MQENELPRFQPKKILLAIDLSARGDRALDRAAQLARQWGAHLVIVHAIDGDTASVFETAYSFPNYPLPSWRRSLDPKRSIQKRIRRDLREEVDQLTIHVEKGEPAQVILNTVDREGCDLIIVGLGREELMGRKILGNTIEHLVRKSPVSVLVVKARPQGAYRHALVGTDFTKESRYGLEVAASSFPDCEFTVMHAFEMRYQASLSDTALGRDFAAMEKGTLEEFVRTAALPDQVRDRIRTLVEHGPPDLMLGRYVEEHHADLTVIGAYGRGFIFHLLAGGYTPRVIDSIPGDVLLVRAHREETSTSSTSE